MLLLKSMTKIIFSHGFGVKADARGMFTEIAANFPEHLFEMFDYNRILENGDIEVASLREQAKKLQAILDKQKDKVILIAHSQGCITAGLVNPDNVKKVILLAPPEKMSMQRVMDKLMRKPGAEVNLDGMSRLPRSDGTTTLISREYIESVSHVNPMEIYQKLADTVPTIIVRCTNDEVLGLTEVNKINNATHRDLEADHDFTGASRARLLNVLSYELNSSADGSR